MSRPKPEPAKRLEPNEGEHHEGDPEELENTLGGLHSEGHNNPGTGTQNAEAQIEDQARIRTAQVTQQNDSLLDDLLNNLHNAEEDADAEDIAISDKPGPFQNKLSPANFAESECHGI